MLRSRQSPSAAVARLIQEHLSYAHAHILEEFAGITIAITLLAVLVVVILMANGLLNAAR